MINHLTTGPPAFSISLSQSAEFVRQLACAFFDRGELSLRRKAQHALAGDLSPQLVLELRARARARAARCARARAVARTRARARAARCGAASAHALPAVPAPAPPAAPAPAPALPAAPGPAPAPAPSAAPAPALAPTPVPEPVPPAGEGGGVLLPPTATRALLLAAAPTETALSPPANLIAFTDLPAHARQHSARTAGSRAAAGERAARCARDAQRATRRRAPGQAGGSAPRRLRACGARSAGGHTHPRSLSLLRLGMTAVALFDACTGSTKLAPGRSRPPRSRALLAYVESPLLRVGLHFLPRATLIVCVNVVPAPRYRLAGSSPGSGGGGL